MCIRDRCLARGIDSNGQPWRVESMGYALSDSTVRCIGLAARISSLDAAQDTLNCSISLAAPGGSGLIASDPFGSVIVRIVPLSIVSRVSPSSVSLDWSTELDVRLSLDVIGTGFESSQDAGVKSQCWLADPSGLVDPVEGVLTAITGEMAVCEIVLARASSNERFQGLAWRIGEVVSGPRPIAPTAAGSRAMLHLVDSRDAPVASQQSY